MRVRGIGAIALVAVAVGVLSSPAAAQSHERARALFEAGRVAVSEGDYESAYRYFTEAYELSQRPRLLFNMANAAERLRRDEEALAHYRHYLEALPDAENAQYVNSRIEALESATESTPAPDPEADPEVEREPDPEADPEAAATPAQEPPEPHSEPEPGPSSEPSSGPSVPAIVVLSVGGAVAVAGAVLLGVSAAERATVNGAPIGSRWDEFSGSHDAANALGALGGALLGVGVATAIGGVIWLVVGDGDEDAEVALVPAGPGLSLRGRF